MIICEICNEQTEPAEFLDELCEDCETAVFMLDDEERHRGAFRPRVWSTS